MLLSLAGYQKPNVDIGTKAQALRLRAFMSLIPISAKKGNTYRHVVLVSHAA
jgi:hypothetical protein